MRVISSSVIFPLASLVRPPSPPPPSLIVLPMFPVFSSVATQTPSPFPSPLVLLIVFLFLLIPTPPSLSLLIVDPSSLPFANRAFQKAGRKGKKATRKDIRGPR